MSRRNMHIRKLSAGFKDQEKCAKALTGRYATDDTFLNYPSTTVLVAEDGIDSVYMPVQTVYFMETMGYLKGTSNITLAKAMKQFVSILVWESRRAGHGELYFVGNKEETNTFAMNNGFEELPYKVFRLKHEATPVLSDEEPHGVEQQQQTAA